MNDVTSTATNSAMRIDATKPIVRTAAGALVMCALCALAFEEAANADETSSSTAAPHVIEAVSSTSAQGIDGIKGVVATFVVAAPPSVIVETLWDIDGFPKIFPDIKSMEVLSRTDMQMDVRFFVDAVVRDAHYTLQRQLDRKNGRISWREVGEGDVRHIRGAWSVVDEKTTAGSSLVTYSSFVDVGVFVPTSMVRDLAIRKIDDMATRVRQASIAAHVAQMKIDPALSAPATPPTTLGPPDTSPPRADAQKH